MDLLTTTEAGRIAGVSRIRVYQWIQDGLLVATQVSGERGPWVIRRADLERMKRRPTGRPKKKHGPRRAG